MDIMTNADFLKQIKNDPSGSFLFYGDEDYLKSHAIKALKEAMGIDEALEIFNFVQLDVLDYTPDKLIDMLSMPPMMAEKKLVVLSGLNIKKMYRKSSGDEEGAVGEFASLMDAIAHLDEFDYNNFVCVCQKNGENYILVVIGAEFSGGESRPAMVTTADIMDYFFDSYSLRSANTLSFPVTEVSLKYSSDADTLLLYADTEVMSILPNDADESSFRKVYNLPESVGAPINAGDVIGTVDYYLAGQKVGTSQLISHDTVERSTVMYLVGKFQEAYQSLYFRVVLAVTFTLVVIYLIYTYLQFKKHEKMQKVHRSRR